MNGKSIGFALLTLAVVVGAWKVTEDRAPQTDVQRTTFYPDLVDQLNDATGLSIRSADQATVLAREGDDWRLANKDGFPADGAKVRKALLQLAQLRTIEAKTRDPERYERLGVDDPLADGAEGRLVEVTAGEGSVLASLVVGMDKTAGTRVQHYVRRAKEAQSWLVEGELDTPADPVPWVDAVIVDVDTERVRSVEVVVEDKQTIRVTKDKPSENFFTLQDIPEGFEQKSKATVSSLGALLLDLRLNDVTGSARVADASPTRTTTIRTFDGLVATLRDYELDETTMTHFEFAYEEAGVYVAAEEAEEGADDTTDGENQSDETEDEAAAETPDENTDDAESPAEESVPEEVARLNARNGDWLYALPKYKRRMIDRDFDSLVKEREDASDESEDEGNESAE